MKSNDNNMSERKKLILKAVIEAHIAFGEPVGSKFLTQDKQIAYSSATVRNEMAELEDMGLLEKPHTSAGRVPSEAGYRYYVDSLIDKYRMTSEEIVKLRDSLRTKEHELDGILQNALRVATAMTNYTSLAVKPKITGSLVRRYDIIRIDEWNFVLVMIMSSGVVKTKSIVSERTISAEAVAILQSLLNEKLSMIDTTKITLPVIMDMESLMGEYDFLVSPVVKAIYATASDGTGDLRFEGVNRLLAYPEFYDMSRLSEMIELFEKKDDLVEVISGDTIRPDADTSDIKIYIGHENVVRIMDNSTLIFKPVKNGGHTVGAIGIIGPTRMDYRRVISMIDHLSDGVSGLIDNKNDDRGNDDDG